MRAELLGAMQDWYTIRAEPFGSRIMRRWVLQGLLPKPNKPSSKLEIRSSKQTRN